MNFLNIARPGEASELEFRIPDDRAEPVFFAFHDPERLRYFEVGPVAPQTLDVRGVGSQDPRAGDCRALVERSSRERRRVSIRVGELHGYT